MTRDEPSFRTDLYRGTAAYYDEFRLGYPDALLDDLCARAAVSGRGSLLDLACGTGQVTFALAPRFAAVCGVDQEHDMIEFARAKAERLGVTNIRWLERRAEDVEPAAGGEGRFELVTVGNAFHRLRRRVVAARARRWLQPGGHLAVLWSSSPWIGGPGSWQHSFDEVLEHWKTVTGSTDRIPPGIDDVLSTDANLAVLAEAGFTLVATSEQRAEHEWTIDALIGHVYSTSFLPRSVFGDAAPAFEDDVRARLLAVEPSGVLRDEVSFAYELVRAP